MDRRTERLVQVRLSSLLDRGGNGVIGRMLWLLPPCIIHLLGVILGGAVCCVADVDVMADIDMGWRRLLEEDISFWRKIAFQCASSHQRDSNEGFTLTDTR